MNLRTTVILVILALGGTLAWFVNQRNQPAPAASPTLTFLEEKLNEADLSRIEVRRGSETRFVLEKTDGDWSLPGKWPVRPAEVNRYVKLLTGLRSRFTPLAIGERDLKSLGLDENALTVQVRTAGQDTTLRVGEESDETQRFTRPTFLRLGDNPEVIRLGPGLVAQLDRTADYFQQRRLFPVHEAAKQPDSQEKVEELAAVGIRAKGKEGEFELVKDASRDDWEMKLPVRDRVDPDRLKSLLVAFADLWAEKFIERKDKTLDEFGLADPEFRLVVTKPSKADLKVLVGKVSREDTRIILKQPPPHPAGIPQKPVPFPVTEEYRYAKLEGYEQIFEIKADKLKEIAVNASDLRDARLARFKTDAVKRLQIDAGKETIALTKEKEGWRFEKSALEAETGPVRELLDKLSDLEAKDTAIMDNADRKSVGLEKPLAVIKVSIEEDSADKAKGEKVKKDIVWRLGVKEKDRSKVYVAVEDWPRINVLDHALLKLVERPAIAYRNRKIVDVAVADLNKIEIERRGEKFALENDKKVWRAGTAELDQSKVEGLVRELARLEAVDFVADHPKKEELEKFFDPAQPALTATLTFLDAKKQPAQKKLTIGKQRDGKDDYFARVDSGPVFALRKSLRDDLDRDALSYRSLDLWKHAEADVALVAIRKDGQDFRVRKDGLNWKIEGSFDATALPLEAEGLVRDIAHVKIVKYVTDKAKDLSVYGLDKPGLKLDVEAASKPDQKHDSIVVGKEAEGKTRYAMRAGQDGVFTLEEKTVTAFDRTAYSFLDSTVLVLEPASLERLRGQGQSTFTLQKKDGAWQVTDSPAPPFTGDDESVQAFLGSLYNLRGDKVVAYGPKINWPDFGLDKPAYTLTVTTSKPADKDKSPKTVEHVVSLDKENEKGERFARLDKEDRVVLLGATVSKTLVRTHVDFVNTRVLRFDLDAVTSIVRKMPGADVELVKREDNWRMVKPLERAADEPTVGDILEKTFRLKAERVAEYPAKNLDKFGLDKPAAIVTLKANDGEHVIKLGSIYQDEKKKGSGQRYALIDKGEAVVVLSKDLSRHLVAPVLYFADRNLATFASADAAVLERGPRKLTFRKTGDNWKTTEPVKADAEDVELQKLIKAVRRLRADEIVADKGADLKAYGLDPPEARWRFLSGNREVLQLAVGKEKDGRRFGMLGNGGMVFLLNPEISKLVVEEFRGRTPLPAFDAAQVDKLIVTGPAPFTLKKSENSGWTLLSDVTANLSSRTINDTLDALAALRAVRYVVDDKADKKPYGLDPPVWKLEVHTPSGKRTLHLGRGEGDAKRLYAAVPESSAVFVVDEATVSRLLRPAAAYIEPKK